MSHLASSGGLGSPHAASQARLAYVIEVGDVQAGLVSRRPDERYFTFISASEAFHAMDGHRFASPGAAELAARQLGASRRRPGAGRLAS